MSSTKQQLLLIEPKSELYFEGPFNNVVLSTIKLTNPLGSPVCFKVKTTVPKRYCVRPSSGVLEPDEVREVAVMLQPFNYDPTEKTKHKFMIQSMVLPEGVENLENVWKEADPSKIMDSKLICILRLPGELVVQPSHELSFEGPFTQAVYSNVTLKNPSSSNICFKLHASSERLSASPTTGMIEPNEKVSVTVVIQPFKYDPDDKPRERILIKSAVTGSSDASSFNQLLDGPNATEILLKCVFTLPSADEKIKPYQHGHSVAAAPESPSPTTKNVDALLAEIAALRRENAVLKEADIRLRRSALSGTCLTSAEGGGAAIGRTGVIGAIASVPPILYLILALLIGLVLGKLM